MSDDTFPHGVASADPTGDAVVIWTRVNAPAGHDADLAWTVATDPDLREVAASGTTSARADDDHTALVDVTGLDPGTTYFFGFRHDDAVSPTGRTRTLAARPDRLRFAVCSCAKRNAGFFNAYGRIAQRDDLDFLLHLGDYIYEAANVPPPPQTPGADIGRPFDPLEECRSLEDYRTRYRQYHADSDVQAMHAALPIVATWDDHEFADGSWSGGADAHDPEQHGPWADRMALAFKARWENVPGRKPDPADPSRVFRQLSAGDLADLFLVDIRTRRDQPLVGEGAADPGRTMLGDEQREWLLEGLGEANARWRLLCSPSVLGRTWIENPTEPLLTGLLKLKLLDEDGEGCDEDQWDGYPAERSVVLDELVSRERTAVISGDIHVSLVTQAAHGNGAVTEFTTPSLTSQNLDEKLKVPERDPRILETERALVDGLPWARWCELASHGYMIVDVDEDRVRVEYWHVAGVLEPTTDERLAAAFELTSDGTLTGPIPTPS